MKFSINKLGPIDEAELELGDITVILGPPNTGKSYTLKALYASLLMLDQVAREFELRTVIDKLDVWEPRPDYTRGIFKILSTIAALYKSRKDLKSEETKKIIDDIKVKASIDQVEWTIDANIITIVLKKEDFIHLNKLSEVLKEKVSSLWDLLPITDNTQVKLISETSIPEIHSILLEGMRQPFTRRREYYDQDLKLRLIYEVSLKSKEGKLKIEKKIEINWDMENSILKKLGRRRSVGDVIFEHLYLRLPSSLRWEIRRLERLEHTVVNYLIKSIGESFEVTYRESFGLQSTRFIPFGRCPLVCQLEYISREPIFRRGLIESYEFDPIFYAYISWLSKGRAKLSEVDYDEKVVQIFNPVLQGEVKYNKQTHEIEYERWGYKKVPIKWASALAGEVTGVLLPTLTVPSKSCLIMEEPEAQLHYSAQVLMALTLARLSSVFGHKIVFSTHSDVFAITMAYLKELKPNEEKLVELIKELLHKQDIHVERDSVEPLAKAASKARDLDIRFYYYEPTSKGVKVSERKAEDILREAPGITTVMDALASWALSL